MLSTGALLSTPPSVAVIGGGVAGLACARKLQELGLSRTVVYDTGKHAVGGRASSRTWRGQPADHAAQFVAATTPEFGAYMEGLETAGVARRLAPGELGHVRAPGAATPLDDASNIMPATPVSKESLAALVADRVEAGGAVRIGIIGGGAGDGCLAEDSALAVSMARAEDGRPRIGVIGGGAGDGRLAEEPDVGMTAGRRCYPGVTDVAILAASSSAITNQKPAVRNRHVYRPPRSSGV